MPPYKHHKVFYETYGDGTHLCFRCNKPIRCRWTGYKLRGCRPYYLVVHHKDGDHSNNSPENLVLGHFNCHHSHHRSIRVYSSATRERISASLTGRQLSPEHRAKISAAMKRRNKR